jgi:RNAse (barnase) inhibitor barstar
VTGFVFVEEPDEYREPAALIVRMPRGIRSKCKLLAILDDKLKFPRYFGWNWDALNDCLTSAVADANRPIVVVHADLPFGKRSELRSIYLSLLRDVAVRTDLGGGLKAVFAARDEASVRAAASGQC